MAADALQFEQPRLLDVVKFVKRVRISSKITLTGVIGLLAMLPSILLTLNPMAGAYGTVAALVLLLVIALKDDKCRKLALAASILPLALMAMAVYPYNSDSFSRSWVEYDVMLLLAIVYSYLFREKLAKKHQLKLKQLPQVVPMMVIIGEVLGVVGYWLLKNHYDFKGASLPLVALVVIVFAITEELLFRGLIQRQAMKLTNKKFAVAMTVAVYGAASIGTNSMLPVLFGVVSALVLSTIYSMKQNLVLTSTANIAMKLTYVGLIASFVLR